MLIILDLDGTILNSQKQHINSFVKAIRKSGTYAGKQILSEVKNRMGIPGHTLLREVLPDVNEIIIKTILISAKHILYNEEFENITLLPGAKAFLENHYKNHTIALASSASREFAEKILDKFELRKYFKVILTADDVIKAKPNPEILNKAIQETGFSKQDTIFLGDTIYDYQAARKAEIRFIGITGDSLFANELIKNGETVKFLDQVKLPTV